MQHAHQKVNPDIKILNKRINRFPTTCAPLPFGKGWQRLSKKHHAHTQIEALHRAHLFHPPLCFQEAAVLTDKLLNFTTCSQNEKSAILEEGWNPTCLYSFLSSLHGLCLTAPECSTQYTLERWGGEREYECLPFSPLKLMKLKQLQVSLSVHTAISKGCANILPKTNLSFSVGAGK